MFFSTEMFLSGCETRYWETYTSKKRRKNEKKGLYSHFEGCSTGEMYTNTEGSYYCPRSTGTCPWSSDKHSDSADTCPSGSDNYPYDADMCPGSSDNPQNGADIYLLCSDN
jgi:hypothetical protein